MGDLDSDHAELSLSAEEVELLQLLGHGLPLGGGGPAAGDLGTDSTAPDQGDLRPDGRRLPDSGRGLGRAAGLNRALTVGPVASGR